MVTFVMYAFRLDERWAQTTIAGNEEWHVTSEDPSKPEVIVSVEVTGSDEIRFEGYRDPFHPGSSKAQEHAWERSAYKMPTQEER